MNRQEKLEKQRAYYREYYKKNRDKIRAKAHERWVTNPAFRKKCADYQRAYMAKRIVLDPTPRPAPFDARKYIHEWYQRNRDKQILYNRAYRAINREKLARRKRELVRSRKAELVKMFGGKCMDCGFVGQPCCYHFDHRDPDTKQYNVGEMLEQRAFAACVEEAKQCDLVCANCHAVRTVTSPAVNRKLRRAAKLNRVGGV